MCAQVEALLNDKADLMQQLRAAVEEADRRADFQQQRRDGGGGSGGAALSQIAASVVEGNAKEHDIGARQDFAPEDVQERLEVPQLREELKRCEV